MDLGIITGPFTLLVIYILGLLVGEFLGIFSPLEITIEEVRDYHNNQRTLLPRSTWDELSLLKMF